MRAEIALILAIVFLAFGSMVSRVSDEGFHARKILWMVSSVAHMKATFRVVFLTGGVLLTIIVDCVCRRCSCEEIV